MGSEPEMPDDALEGALSEAVERVRCSPVSDDFVEKCAERAIQIPASKKLPSVDRVRDLPRTQNSPKSSILRAILGLTASILIMVSLNALQFVLDRPDPRRQQAALFETPTQTKYWIYSDLRVEPVVSAIAPR